MTDAAAPLVELSALGVRFGSVAALCDVTLRVPRAKTCAVVGPNGAGKSALLRVLAGRLACSSGLLHWHSPLAGSQRSRRARIGYASQALELDPELSVREHLALFCALEQLPRAERDQSLARVVEGFGLEAFLERRVQHCSGGMRQRLHVALAFLKQPPLLLLDEPASALDSQARAALAHAIAQRAGLGHTTLLVSHDLREASAADHVFVFARGRLVAKGAPGDLGPEHADLHAAYRALTGAAPTAERAEPVRSRGLGGRHAR